MAPLRDKNWDMTKLFLEYAEHSKMIFHTNNYNNSDMMLSPNSRNLHFEDIFIGIFIFVIKAASSLASSYRVVAFLHPSSTLLHAVNVFQSRINFLLKMPESENVKERILEAYKDLKKLNDLYGEIWGGMTLVSMLDYIVWLATDLDAGLQATNWMARLSVTWYFVAVVLPLVAGGEIKRKVHTLKVYFCHALKNEKGSKTMFG